MRLHRFFVEQPLRNTKEVILREDGLVHQLKDVFRLRSGDKLILLDNFGLEFLAEIVSLDKNGAEMKILESTMVENIPKREIWLFAALIKKDNFEFIVEKGTELGVSHFVPVLSDRSEKKNLNQERTLKIIKESSEQSGRGTMPVLNEALKFDGVFDFAIENNVKLIGFHPEGEKSVSEDPIRAQDKLNFGLKIKPEPIGSLIGPEGGWSEREIELFKSRTVPVYSLGKQTLRAETAAIAVSVLFLL
jgi:16S rRNA (uracil1498-N3)-methyltransferase